MKYTKIMEMRHGTSAETDTRYDRCILVSDEALGNIENTIEFNPFKLVVEFNSESLHGAIEASELESNIILKHNSSNIIESVLEGEISYKGTVLMSIIGTKVTELEDRCAYIRDSILNMENELLESSSNSGIKGVLGVRKEYLKVGEGIIFIDRVFQSIDQGKLVMLMQNSYVAMGIVMDRLKLLKRQYELIGLTILKDIDAYTSMANNNINNNALYVAIAAVLTQLVYIVGTTSYIAGALVGIIGSIGVAIVVLYKKKGKH